MTDAARHIAISSAERSSPSEASRPRPDEQPPGHSFALLLAGRRAETSRGEAAPAIDAGLGTLTGRQPWQQTRYLTTAAVPKVYLQPGLVRAMVPSANPELDGAAIDSVTSTATPLTVGQGSMARLISSSPGTSPVTPSPTAPSGAATPIKANENVGSVGNHKPMGIEDFPRPPADNGWGMHWIPTVSSAPDVVDRFVREAREMGMTWMVFLNDHAQIGANDYLVTQLVNNGIMPVMRIYTPGLAPIQGDLEGMVQHYRRLGVSYFQIYNEPNLRLENDGAEPDVNRYLDAWIPAARRVVAAGGLPGFGALSPQGEMDDRAFLREALEGLKARGEAWLLDRGWLSMHNYAGHRPLDDPDGFLRFRQYANILEQSLGRLIPIVGTEAGTYIDGHVDAATKVDLVTGAYRYMATQAEHYNFAYTYWIIANHVGGGHDDAWEWQALFQRNGWVSPLVDALRAMAKGRE